MAYTVLGSIPKRPLFTIVNPIFTNLWTQRVQFSTLQSQQFSSVCVRITDSKRVILSSYGS